MMLGGVGMILFLLLAKNYGEPWYLVAGTLAAGGWWAGVFVVTQPRRSAIRPYAEMVQEWKRTRMTNRVSQALWVVAIAIGATAMFVHQAAMNAAMASPTATVGMLGATPRGAEALNWLAGVCALVASIGLVPLCVQLSDLADWSGDTGLGNRLRVAAWGLAFGIPTITFVPLIGAITGVASTILVVLNLMFVLAIITLVGCSLMFLTCLFSQCSMAFWAVRNSISGRKRDIRVATKKAERYDGIVSRQMANAPVDPAVSLNDTAPVTKGTRAPGAKPKGPYVEPAKPGDTYGIAED